MKTAVEWLADELKKNHGIDLRLYDEFEQAKEMEKQQNEHAFNESRKTHPLIGFKHETFEQYYNETFKSE